MLSTTFRLFLVAVPLFSLSAIALESDFTYQGRLSDSGQAFTGTVDFEFGLFDQLSGDSEIATPQTRPNWPVEDGLFQVDLDFGAAAFDGGPRFLEVRVNGVPLIPRQRVTATPYALLAAEVSSGSIDAASIDPSQVQLRVTGSCPEGLFMRAVNQNGTVICGFDNPGWSLTGNPGTNPSTSFLGTTDAAPFQIRTNNARSFMITPDADANRAPTIVAGHPGNSALADTSSGSVISGGGAGDAPNSVSSAVFSTISGGAGNQIFSFGHNVIGGGRRNVNSGSASVISGGEDNRIGFADPFKDAPDAATIAGGLDNLATGSFSTVGGGFFNRATGPSSTVGGGYDNSAIGDSSAVGGGFFNRASDYSSTIGGGLDNVASGFASTISGGRENTASGFASQVFGGDQNCAGGNFSSAGGSQAKVRPGTASGDAGSGCFNVPLSGDANGDNGTFVWADSQIADFVSSGPNQFLVRAANGLGLNTSTPQPAHLTIGKNDGSNNVIALGFLGDVTRWRIGGLNAGSGSAFEVQSGGDQVLFRVEDAGAGSRVGVSRDPTGNALEVEGDASKTVAGGWLANSDARIKTDVQEIDGALDRLMQVRPVSFRYTDDYRAAHPGVGEARHFNVIAQEFARVFPDAVKESGEMLPGRAAAPDNEILQVDVHPALITSIAAVQELAVRLEQAEAENEYLRRQIARQRSEVEARLTRLEELLGNAEAKGSP